MRPHALLATVFILILVHGCVKQEGNISGTVSPAGPGIIVTATQDGKVIVTAQARPDDGRFNLIVPAGRYDVTIAARTSPYPMNFPGIQVQSGKTADLASIPLASDRKGSSSLSGRVIPPRAGAEVALYSEGRERASIATDSKGEYLFKEIPAGSYTLQAKAPEYAPDRVPVTVSEEAVATKNITLFYASAIDGVDWTEGTIRVTGIGTPPGNASNSTVRRETAKRAALSDAQRKLIQSLAEIKTGPDHSLHSQLGEENFRTRIQGFVKGYRITGEREMDDGRIEIDLELPLTGQDGLSRYLAH